MGRKPVHVGPPAAEKPIRDLGRRLFAAVLIVVASASAQAVRPIEDGPDPTGDLKERVVDEGPTPFFTSDAMTGKIDPGLSFVDARPTEAQCRAGCLNPANGQWPPPGCHGQGFMLIGAEPGVDTDGNGTCHCVWACYSALKWLIGGPPGGLFQSPFGY